jgi:hypothetical protein
MHAEIDKETEMLDGKQHGDSSIPQPMLYRDKNSLEAIPSKRVGAHNCLQSWDRYMKLVGEVHGRRGSQGEHPGSHWTGISSISPLPLPRY